MREQTESKNAPVPPCTHFIRSHSLYGPSFLKIIIHKLIHLRQTVGQLIRKLHKVIGCVIVIHPYHIFILIQIIQVERIIGTWLQVGISMGLGIAVHILYNRLQLPVSGIFAITGEGHLQGMTICRSISCVYSGIQHPAMAFPGMIKLCGQGNFGRELLPKTM